MMKHYNSYKDSGIEWIGEIPSHWEVKKLKYGINLINTKGIPQSSDVKISPENVETGTGVCLSMYSDYEGEGLKFIYGDILLNKLRIYLKKILLTTYEGYSMGEMIVLRCKSDSLVNKYLFYSLFHDGLIQLLNSQSNGVKLPRVSPEVIINSEYMFPPLSEQEHIVSYLDDKTTKIDELIQKKLRKIDLLKEYRTSLINTVVTKGLNPDVPMKDSGIEWIGEIPSHWILSRIGRHFFMERGRVISKEEISDNLGEYPVYSSQTENYGVLGSINTFDFEGEYVTWTTDGANAGTCFYRIGKFNTTNVCGLLSHKVSGRNNLKFLNYLLNLGTKGYVRVDINPKLMNNMIGDIPFVSPPLSEQEHIVSYLDEKTSQIDKTIDIEKKKIELLKEYRKSLISNVVTGKIKVTE